MKWAIIFSLLFWLPLAGFAQPVDWLERRMERLDERLGLTEEQKPKVEAILREQREKIQAVRQETRKRLKEVLTPEQLEKFERLHEERKKRWHRRFFQP